MLKVKIDASLLNTDFRKKRAMEQVNALEIILNSDDFHNAVYNMPDKYRECEVSKYKTYETWEIYSLIKTGGEEWNGIVDNEVDIILEDYTRKWSKVIGYVIPGKKLIHVNAKYFDTMSPDKLCGHLFHEYTHLLGFKHAGHDLTLSFSYYLGNVVKDLYKKLILDDSEQANQAIFKTVCKRVWYYLWLKKKCYLVRVNQ